VHAKFCFILVLGCKAKDRQQLAFDSAHVLAVVRRNAQ